LAVGPSLAGTAMGLLFVPCDPLARGFRHRASNCGFVISGLGILLALCGIKAGRSRLILPLLKSFYRESRGTVPPAKTPRLAPGSAPRTAKSVCKKPSKS
jgi:hypothetical protein